MQHLSRSLSTCFDTWDLDASVTEPASLPTPWVEKIFTRLSAQLGHKVADLYACVAPEDVKAEWGCALAGFHPAEIGRGLNACQTRVFAPTLGEFLRLCRPALDPELAWIEAVDGLAAGEGFEWSHPAVRRAARTMPYEIRSQSFAQCRKRWAWTLDREFEKGWEVEPSAPKIKMATRKAPERAPEDTGKAVKA